MTKITIHTAADFEKMRIAGRLAAETLDMIGDHVEAGITTSELDKICHDFIVRRRAIPAPLGYRGYPKSICTSVNHVVCHGIPDGTKLKDGDIINIDVTTIVDGWHGDTSRMYFVGRPRVMAKRLCQVTFEAMWRGINTVKPGSTVGDIGHAIQTFAEGFNYSIVKDYCGHGIGKIFHTAPNIMHFGEPGTGDVLQPGMFFTVEPMINVGAPETRLSQHDGWTVTTRDRSLSAQFEHTIGVIETGFEVFTLSPNGLDHPEW
jgi:methionyl aminopeptidase